MNQLPSTSTSTSFPRSTVDANRCFRQLAVKRCTPSARSHTNMEYASETSENAGPFAFPTLVTTTSQVGASTTLGATRTSVVNVNCCCFFIYYLEKLASSKDAKKALTDNIIINVYSWSLVIATSSTALKCKRIATHPTVPCKGNRRRLGLAIALVSRL